MPDHVGAPAPLDLRTCPETPAAVKAKAEPVPYAAAPAVGVAVELVPPLAIPSVPPSVSVPEDVTGPPVKVMPVVPPEASTLVTVPTTVEAIKIEPPPLVMAIADSEPKIKGALSKVIA